MTTVQAQRNIKLLLGLNFLTYLGFWHAIEQLYLYAIGADEWAMAVGLALWAGAQLVLEVPSGYFADHYGRKRALLVGKIFRILGFSAILIFYSLPAYYIAILCFGVAFAFTSGADNAFLHENLKFLGKVDQYKRYSGRMKTMFVLGALLGGLLAIPISLVSYRWNWGLSLIPPIIALGLLVFMTETIHSRSAARVNFIQATKTVTAVVASNSALLLWVLLAAIIAMVQIMALDFGQAFIFDTTGIALLATVAWVLGAFFRLAANEFARFYHKGPWPLALAALGLLLVMSHAEGWLSIFLYLCLFVPVNIAAISCEEAVQKNAPADLRATTLSSVNLFNRIVMLVPILLFGSYISNTNAIIGFQKASMILIGLALCVFVAFAFVKSRAIK